MDVNKLKAQAQVKAQEFQGKAQDFLKEHHDQLEGSVTKAQKFAKSKTNRHDDKIDKMAGKIRGLLPMPDDGVGGTRPPGSPTT